MMISLILLCTATLVAGAAIERRIPVPPGYVASPYYPGMFC